MPTMMDARCSRPEFVDASSYIEGCEAKHVLTQDTTEFWLSGKGMPQHITFRCRGGPIRAVGWHCWRSYSTNPKQVVFQASDDGVHFNEFLKLSLSACRAGDELFDVVGLDCNKTQFLRLVVEATFGSSQVCINVCHFFSCSAELAASSVCSTALPTPLLPPKVQAESAVEEVASAPLSQSRQLAELRLHSRQVALAIDAGPSSTGRGCSLLDLQSSISEMQAAVRSFAIGHGGYDLDAAACPHRGARSHRATERAPPNTALGSEEALSFVDDLSAKKLALLRETSDYLLLSQSEPAVLEKLQDALRHESARQSTIKSALNDTSLGPTLQRPHPLAHENDLTETPYATEIFGHSHSDASSRSSPCSRTPPSVASALQNRLHAKLRERDEKARQLARLASDATGAPQRQRHDDELDEVSSVLRREETITWWSPAMLRPSSR